jgi:hypothetical protein
VLRSLRREVVNILPEKILARAIVLYLDDRFNFAQTVRNSSIEPRDSRDY